MRITGSYKRLGSQNYFIPNPLPPYNPPLILDEKIITLYGQALFNLGKLDEMAKRLPDIKHFIKAYVIKEALLSSSIEGINTTLADVYTQPLLESKPNKSTQLVINYAKALDTALTMLIKQNLPISSRVILGAHKALMELGEGESDPGSYRKQAVRVGNLTPPPPTEVPELMSQLEQYINDNILLPPLIKSGLVHVQFETIHPFLDGNGRIGRLLIVLMLFESKILTKPIVYPSYYFKKHQHEYYFRLDRVRTHGDFEGWLLFYLAAIIESSRDALQRAEKIEDLQNSLTSSIISTKQKTNKALNKRIEALSILFSHPIIDSTTLSSQIQVSYNSAQAIITDLVQQGILTQETQQKRNKLFRFTPYLNILEQA